MNKQIIQIYNILLLYPISTSIKIQHTRMPAASCCIPDVQLNAPGPGAIQSSANEPGPALMHPAKWIKATQQIAMMPSSW